MPLGRSICCKYFTVSLVPVTALTLALIFAAGILSLPIIYTELAKKYQYGVVIDAGSSHTELYVYQMEVPITGAVHQVDNYKNHTSLDSFAENPAGVRELLRSLLSDTNTTMKSLGVKESLYAHTHLYLGATAGMRLLKMENKSAHDLIMSIASETLEESGYHCNKKKCAVTINGEQEAGGGWATANYISHTKGSTGSLDMGGASTEIAFYHSNSSTGHYYFTERLLEEPYRIYGRSYLCYGHKEAEARFLAYLYDQSNDSSPEVDNPCLARGYKMNVTGLKLNTSCTRGYGARTVFGFTLDLPLAGDVNIIFNGTGDPDACQEKIASVFNFSACYPAVNCADKAFEVPPVQGHFVGFSGFAWMAEKLKINEMVFNHSNTVMEVVRRSCSELLKINSTECYCFFGLFAAHIMEKGFGMNATNPNWTVAFENKKDDKSFGWALGYLMNKTHNYNNNYYHEVTPYSGVDLVMGMLILTILCAIFVIFFILTFYACKKVLKARNGYQSIS